MLVVGGGPVGLSLVLRLGQLGVPAALVERNPDTRTSPKAHALNFRTMEIFRCWGLEPEIAAVGLPGEQLAFFTGRSLVDADGTRIAAGRASRTAVGSPSAALRCSQERLEPLLRAHAERLHPGRIRFDTTLVDLVVEAGGVTATLVGSGQREQIRARYLIAADSATNGIRDRRGIFPSGCREVSHHLDVLFDADLDAHVVSGPCAGYAISRPGLHGTFLVVDGRRRRPITLLPWQVWGSSTRVADRFRYGPVLLAGDAAHVAGPDGGCGVNCGIADADNLAWKLAAVHQGWATPALLDTYEPERRPVALACARESHRRLGEAVEALRAGRRPTSRPREGLLLGYHYASTSVVADGTPPPDDDPLAGYTPTARPGHRIPHAWLDQAQIRSTLDLVSGTGYTLLAAPAAEIWARTAVRIARATGLPLRCHALHAVLPPSALVAYLDRCGLREDGVLLVRPDGHVAWRGPSTMSVDPVEVLRQVHGRCRPVAKRGPGTGR